MEKKGSIDDKVYVFIVFISMIIIVIALTQAWGVIQPTLYDSLNANLTRESLNNMKPAAVTGWLDVLLVFLYFGLNIVACIILPLYVENNPIYFIVVAIFLFFWTLMVAIIGNSIIDILSSISTGLTYTGYLVDNVIVTEVIFGIIMLIVMFSKLDSGGFGGGGNYA